ncbi:MAG: complex I subunit 1 family protein [Candidatus Caldarchaeales archaeon]|jgi:NADH-quinone oxidoreductase subunit H|nr:complex I subunit 1 family protein [Candidatus Caldarchaeales archaeon]MDT7915393.1 complex I subunit 1 family protein [Candidatus Caldarchaeales archaeon]
MIDPVQMFLQFFNQLPPQLQEIVRFLYSEPFIKAAIFPGALFSTLVGLFAVWFERKLFARVSLRIGPLHVGRVSGLLQLVADAVKFLSKERIIPEGVNRPLFVLMPCLALVLSLLLYAFLPFGAGWIIFPSDIGLLLFFLVAALTPVPIVLAGYASRSKYPFIGMSRMALQLFAYEIPLFLALLGVVLAAGSLNLEKIVEAQLAVPFAVTQVLGFIVFTVTMLAETERLPFDIPTAEGEIVFGWQTEYSGVYFLMIQLAMFEKVLAFCFLAAIIYLGGWIGPPIPGVPETISAPFWVILKALLVFTFVALLRGVYPRLTIEKVLDLGWRYLIPLGLVNLILVASFSLAGPIIRP